MGQPVAGRVLDGHRLRLAEDRLSIAVQIPELVPFFGLGLAAYLAAGSLAVRAVPERDDAAPAAGAPPVLVRVAAGRLAVVVDAVVAPGHGVPLWLGAGLHGNRMAPAMAPASPRDLANCGLDLVGGTRFELVTSSVSGKRSPTELTAREAEAGIEPAYRALQALA